MPSSNVIVSTEVRAILDRSTISADRVVLPANLDRADYVAVNKVLELAGGNWHHQQKAHLFDRNPREVLGMAVATGSIRDDKKHFQAYYTPDSLARAAVVWLGDLHRKRVLEPSAGGGALAKEARLQGGTVTCIDLNPQACIGLKLQSFDTMEADFLATHPSDSLGGLFDAVVMNPPFKGDADIRHVVHALHFLKPTGRLVAIMSPRFQFANTKLCRDFRAMVENEGTAVVENPAGTFSESGTEIRTVMLTLTGDCTRYFPLAAPVRPGGEYLRLVCIEDDEPMNTTPEPHAPQGQKLDGFNLQAVLDSGTNVTETGRNQFFTPPEFAEAFCTVLPQTRETFVDLTMGNGGLFVGAKAEHCLGVDIDPRCAAARNHAMKGRSGRWHTLTADVTKLYPLLAEAGWDADLFGLNPPFSVRWHKDRLADLAESSCDAVARTFNRTGGDTIDSTLATFLIALDRMTHRGEGYLIANEATAIRFFGHPDDPAPAAYDTPRAHVWLWLTVPPGVFEGVRDFNTAVLYFARGQKGIDPVHVTASAATPEAVRDALLPMVARKYSVRTGSILFRSGDFCPRTVPVFEAVCQEYKRREQTERPTEFNLWLSDGTIRRHLTPFQSFSGRIPKDAAKILQEIEGKTPMALVTAKQTRLQLLRAVRSDYWTVDPALVAAVDQAVREYGAGRAPFYPLNDVQRLGFLDEEDAILCKQSGHGFTAGRRYAIECSTESVTREHTRPNIMGEPECVSLMGKELAIVITDDDKKEHIFRVQDADDDGQHADKRAGRIHESVATLLEIFEVPQVPDMALVHPEKFAANVEALHAIEARLDGLSAAA